VAVTVKVVMVVEHTVREECAKRQDRKITLKKFSVLQQIKGIYCNTSTTLSILSNMFTCTLFWFTGYYLILCLHEETTLCLLLD